MQRHAVQSGLFVVVLALMLAGAADAQQFRVFVGTYTAGDSPSEGIYTCVLDASDGSLTEPVLAAEAVNPSFLAIRPDGQHVFCVNEVSEDGGSGRPTGSVTAFRISSEDGMLERINSQSSLGGAPCHCNVDASGRWLLVANYVGGNVVVFPIAKNGGLSPPSSNIQHEGSSVNPQRQEGPHAHSINLSSDNRYAYAADLGLDRILIYEFNADDGRLIPNSPYAVAVSPGGGPRHFSLSPDNTLAWSNNELTATVTGFRRDVDTGGLTPIQEITTLPEDFDGRRSTAECLVHPSGRFLYVSNRGHDSIAVFRIHEESGMLAPVEIETTGGEEPRNFAIEPTGRWLLAANQRSDSVIVFSIDKDTGELTPTDEQITVGRPVCIRFLAQPG